MREASLVLQVLSTVVLTSTVFFLSRRWAARRKATVLDLAKISTELRAHGFFVLDNFVGREYAARMSGEMRGMRERGELQPGRLQHGATVTSNTQTRGDIIRFFSPPYDADDTVGTEALRGYFHLMEDLRAGLEGDLELADTVRGGMELCKSMCACYPGDGTRYVRHRDAWPQKPGRKLTLILYLNEGWRAEHGGCLRLWPERKAPSPELEPLVIEPRMDRLVVFCSWLEHEVLPVHSDRFAVTTWFYNAKDSMMEVVADHLRRSKTNVRD